MEDLTGHATRLDSMKLEETKGSSIYDAIPAKSSPPLQRNSPRLCFRPGHFDAGEGGRHRGFCGGKPAGCAQSAGQACGYGVTIATGSGRDATQSGGASANSWSYAELQHN